MLSHLLKSTIMILLAFGVTLGCGKKPHSDAPRNETPTSSDQVDSSGLSLTYQQDFAASVQQIVPRGDGSYLITGITQPTASDLYSGFLEAIGKDGQPIFRINSSKGGAFVGLVSHKSGSFTALEFVERSDAEYIYELEIVRYDATGKENKRTALKSLAAKIFKLDAGCYLDSTPVFADSSSVSAVSGVDEDTIISAFACFQHVVLRLNSEQELLWTKQLTPPLPSRWLYNFSLMTQEADHDVQLLLDLEDEDAAAAASHLGVKALGETSFLVAINSSSGEISSARVLPIEPDSRISAIQAHSEFLYAVGTLSKDNPSRRSKKQNDLLVKAFDLSKLSTTWSRTFNFGNEQLPMALAVTDQDQLIVGGCFGHVVVDMGSWVEFPDAFLAAFNANDGDLIGGKVVRSDRKDSVRSVVIEGDDLLFGGIIDGPITHTADSDATLGYSKGFVRSISINDLLKGEIKNSGQ